MAVAHDASTEGTFTTVSPHEFTHTPTGVPRGILVLIAHGGTSSDLIGAVTCNGETMRTTVDSGGSLVSSDVAGEQGAVYGFWLGENIRPGVQEISITHTGSADVKWFTAISVTANRSVTAYDLNVTNQDQANPSVAITGGTQTSITYGALYSGLDAVGSISLGAGMTAVQDHDFGSFVARVDRQTTPAVGDFTFGYTSASDDVALVAINLAEVDTVLFDGVAVCVEAAFGYGPTDTPGWFDLTDRVRSLSFSRGRSHELDQIQAGSASFALDNQDGALNGHNTSNPGNWVSTDVKPMVPIRVTADYSGVSYPLWYGFVEGWPVSFPGQVDSVVTVSAVDLFKLLALARVPDDQSATTLALTPDAYWRFTGTATADSSGNSHTFTFAGSPTTGVTGAWTDDQAVTFDGTNDTATVATETVLEYVDVPMTIAAWVNLDSTAGNLTVASCSESGGINQTWNLCCISGDWKFVYGGFVFAGPTASAAETWQHIAVTRSATEIKFYLNGVLTADIGYSITVGAATRTVHIGSLNASTNWFDGEISELALWGSALSSADISAIYHAQLENFAEQLTSARVESLLTEAGFTSQDLETGLSTMSAGGTGGSILDEITAAVDTEAGLFFMTGAGVARFHDRHFRTIDQATPIDEFNDTSGLSYVDIIPSYDDTQIWNEIVVTPNDGDTAFTATDDTSRAAYGQRTLSINTYPADELEAEDRANWTLGLYKEPATRIETLVCKPRGDSDLWPILLDAEISNRYTVAKTLAGDDLSQDVYLEAIHFDFQPKDCTVTLQLSPASSQSFWLLGEAGFSELGETTTLGW